MDLVECGSDVEANKYIFVASYEKQAGTLQAEYVMKKLNKKEMNIFILMVKRNMVAQ